MSYQNNSFNNKKENTMSEEKFNQIIDAILDGKYSWACVLILETAGYNPLHYIPYRTYNRLIKINCTSNQSNTQSQTKLKQNSSSNKGQEYPSSSKIQDLDHVKTNYNQKIQGGIASINFLNFTIYI